MYRSNAYAYLVCQFSDSDTTVLHDQSLLLVDDIVISASWGPTVTWFAVHWCAAIFEAVVPFLYSCDTHGIVPESLLNLSSSFHLGIAKLFAEFDAIPLLKSLHHFAIIDNPTSIHNTYTIIDCCRRLALTAGGKKFTHAHKCPLHIYNDGHFPCLICLGGKN